MSCDVPLTRKVEERKQNEEPKQEFFKSLAHVRTRVSSTGATPINSFSLGFWGSWEGRRDSLGVLPFCDETGNKALFFFFFSLSQHRSW